jgi:predicted nucleic acid-binding protein
VGEIEGFWERYRHVTEGVHVRANLVPDAHLVALMHQHGVSTIWSRDRDLRKFDGITARDPFSDRFRDGFGAQKPTGR